jgi:hypothetical protein
MIVDPIMEKLRELYLRGDLRTADYLALMEMLEDAFIRLHRQLWEEAV